MRWEEHTQETIRNTQKVNAALKAAAPKAEEQRKDATRKYVQAAMTTKPPSSYQGPHFKSFPPTLDEVKALIKHYASSSIPLHEKYLVQLLTAGTQAYSKVPRVNSIETLSGKHQKLVVVGDLHGQLQDLIHIFMLHGYPDSNGTQYLFNGDFVDRGENGVEVVALMLAFKALHPTSVHMNRGNHEAMSLNVSYGFFDEVCSKYTSNLIHNCFLNLWNNLPLATVIDKKVCVLHGGLFRASGVALNHINEVPRMDCDVTSDDPRARIMCDIMWNDPQKENGRSKGMRGASSLFFGPDVTSAFLARNGLELLIRSHQVPEDNRGCEVMHNGRLITVFSASNYCNSQDNEGGLVIFTKPLTYTLTEFRAPPLEHLAGLLSAAAPNNAKPTFALSQNRPKQLDSPAIHLKNVQGLKHLITENVQQLRGYFRDVNQNRDGKITLKQWRTGLLQVLQLNLNLESYEVDLVKCEPDGSVNWKKFIESYEVVVDSRWQKQFHMCLSNRLLQKDMKMHDLLRLFDKNGDGILDVQELLHALPGLGMGLTEPQVKELLADFEDEQGRVHVIDFIESMKVEYTGADLPTDVQEAINAIGRAFARSKQSGLQQFKELDRNGDGLLQYEEFAQFLTWFSSQHPKYKPFGEPPLIKRVFQALDLNKSGTLNFIEFVDAFKPSKDARLKQTNRLVALVIRALYNHRLALKEVFYRLDADGSGTLSQDEFRMGLRTLLTLQSDELSDTDLDQVAKMADTDGDGMISINEFFAAFRSTAEEQRMIATSFRKS